MRTVENVNSLDRLAARTGLPRRYLGRRWEDLKVLGDTADERRRNERSLGVVRTWVENAERNLRAGRGLYLAGPLGVGKTLLLTMVGEAVVDVFAHANGELRRAGLDGDGKMNELRFVLSARLSDLVYPPKDADGDEARFRRGLFGVSALMIDDLTKIASSRLGGEVVFLDSVVRTRYHAGLSTFYTSQVPLEDEGKLPGLGKTLSSRAIEDLIAETCDVAVFVGPSERRTVRGE